MGKVFSLPVVKKAIRTSSKDVQKEKNNDAVMDGIKRGKVICWKTFLGEAPKLAAASST